MSLFLCAYSLCRSSVWNNQAAHQYADLQTALCALKLGATDNNKQTFQGKAARSSETASHVTVEPRRGGRGLEKLCIPVKEVQLDF